MHDNRRLFQQGRYVLVHASSFEADADGFEVAMRGGTHDLSVLGMTLLSLKKALTTNPNPLETLNPPKLKPKSYRNLETLNP